MLWACPLKISLILNLFWYAFTTSWNIEKSKLHRNLVRQFSLFCVSVFSRDYLWRLLVCYGSNSHYIIQYFPKFASTCEHYYMPLLIQCFAVSRAYSPSTSHRWCHCLIVGRRAGGGGYSGITMRNDFLFEYFKLTNCQTLTTEILCEIQRTIIRK